MHSLLAGPVRVVNIGLAGFARELAANGAAVVQVDWAPPLHRELLAALAEHQGAIDAANAEALRRIFAADPVLADVRRAGDAIPELDAGRLVLHAGPPIEWARMCGPLRGAICGALVFEGWAADLAAAEALATSGGVRFAPNHHFGAVGPMISATSPARRFSCARSRLTSPARRARRRRWQGRSNSWARTISSSSTWPWPWAKASSIRRRASSARASSRRCAVTAPTSASASPRSANAGLARRWRCRRGFISPAIAPPTPTRTWAIRRSSRR